MAEERIPELLKDLAQAASAKAQVANRYWLALLVVSAFVVFPNVDNQSVQLPLMGGAVREAAFGVVGLLMLAVLVIAFGSAHAEVLRVEKFIYRIVDTADIGPLPGGHDARDFVEALRLPTLTRVAPLAQLLRGEKQFFVDKRDVPVWLLYTSAGCYVAFKVLSWLVYAGAPAVAFARATYLYFNPQSGDPLLEIVVWPFILGGFFVLLQMTINDFLHTVEAWKGITKSA